MRRATILLTTLALAATAAGAGARADTLTVSTTADPPTPWHCPATTDPCSLRAAIGQAFDDGPGDTIELPPGHYRLDGQAAPYRALPIDRAVTIEGLGTAADTIIDAGSNPGVFGVSASATLHNLTVTGSRSAAAIFVVDPKVAPRLVLDHVVVRDNSYIEDTGAAGLVVHAGSTTIDHSAFIANTGVSAGAIESDSGTLVVANSELSDNVAVSPHDGGGAISSSNGTLVVTSSRLSANRATNGGAIELSPGGHGTVVDSTLDANRTGTANGGAVYVDSRASLTAHNDTFTTNAGFALGGTLGGVALANSVLAASSVASCAGPGITSFGHNVTDDASCGLAAGGDRQSTDPRLGPLADNGGPTFTALPLDDSPLIDAADPGLCTTTDQRGVARPQGLGCDIGAAERSAAPVVPPVVPPPPPLVGPPPPIAAVPLPVAHPVAPRRPALRISRLRVAPSAVHGHAVIDWTATTAGHVRFVVRARQHGHFKTIAGFTLATRSGPNHQPFPPAVRARLHSGSYRLEAATTPVARTTFRIAQTIHTSGDIR